jgi:DNA-binding transcriptional regulator YdaS (Cro superfamily)
MTTDEFLSMLGEHVLSSGSQKAAAKELGISVSYLNDVLHKRREPGRKIASAFGMRKVITWVSSEDRAEWRYS